MVFRMLCFNSKHDTHMWTKLSAEAPAHRSYLARKIFSTQPTLIREMRQLHRALLVQTCGHSQRLLMGLWDTLSLVQDALAHCTISATHGEKQRIARHSQWSCRSESACLVHLSCLKPQRTFQQLCCSVSRRISHSACSKAMTVG